jgi:hypothetical protein
MLHRRRRREGVDKAVMGAVVGVNAELKAVSSLGGGKYFSVGMARRRKCAGKHDTRTVEKSGANGSAN